MSISSKWHPTSNTLELVMEEKFSHSIYPEFKDAYKSQVVEEITIKIDMSKVNVMDSAALGMLIQLRQYVDKLNGQVILSNPQEAVRSVLKNAQFEKLFGL